MNRDEIKGKGKDIVGRAERQVGEWTDDGKAQAEGLGKQVEGKAQNALGKVKQAGSDLKRDMDRDLRKNDAESENMDRDQDRERKVG